MGYSVGSDGTLDIVARAPMLSVLAGGVIREGEDVQLKGVLSANEGSISSQDILIRLEWADVSSAVFERTSDELLLLGESGERMQAISSYSTHQILGGRYEIHSGAVRSEEGQEVEVIAASDPVSLVIVGAGILAAACVAGGGVVDQRMDPDQDDTTGH